MLSKYIYYRINYNGNIKLNVNQLKCVYKYVM